MRDFSHSRSLPKVSKGVGVADGRGDAPELGSEHGSCGSDLHPQLNGPGPVKGHQDVSIRWKSKLQSPGERGGEQPCPRADRRAGLTGSFPCSVPVAAARGPAAALRR